MGRTDRISVTAFAKDLGSFVPVDGIVTRQQDLFLGHEMLENPMDQAMRQSPARPTTSTKNAMVARWVTWGQCPQGTQKITDRALAHGEDRSQCQNDKTEKRKSAERACQTLEKRTGRLGQSGVHTLQLTAGEESFMRSTAAVFAIQTSLPTELA